MKRQILTSTVLLLGSSLAVVAGCFTNGFLDCAPQATFDGTKCDLASNHVFSSAVNAHPGSTSSYDSFYSDGGVHCYYSCVKNGVATTRSSNPAGILSGNPCSPNGSGTDGTGGSTGT